MDWFWCFQMALRVWAVSVGKLHCLNSSRSYFCNCSFQARVSSSQGEGRDAHLSCSVLPLVSLGFGWLLFPNPTTGMLFLRLVWSCAWLPQVDGSWPSCGLGLLGPRPHLFNSFGTLMNEGFSEPGNLCVFDYPVTESMMFY